MKLNNFKIFLLCGFAFFFCNIFSIYSQNEERKLPDDAEEGIYYFTYAGIVRYTLNAYLYKDSVYLPLSEIFTKLKIYYEVDYKAKIFTGFYISKDTLFEIRFNEGKATLNKRAVKFNNNDFLASELEIYVVPSLLKKIFDLNFLVGQSSLNISLENTIELPVLSEWKRMRKYGDLADINFDIQYAPLMFDRKRSWLNGGLMDYNLSYSQFRKDKFYGYGVNLGMEVLGGDFQIFTSGNYDQESNISNFSKTYRWRFFTFENPYLTQISLGTISNSSLRVSALPVTIMEGAQISNELTYAPTVFSNYVIQDYTEPGWQVELYVNNQLYAQVVADASGFYKFVIPLYFGGNNIQLKYYGLKGEYSEKRQYFQIPNEFLKPGEIKYTLSAGRRLSDSVKMGEGRVSIGLTTWLSNALSVEKMEATRKLSFYDNINIRLFSDIITRFNIFPDKLYRGDLTTWSQSVGNYTVSYTKYLGISDLNPTGNKSIFTLGGGRYLYFLPVSLFFKYTRVDNPLYVTNILISNSTIFINPFMVLLRYANNYLVNNDKSFSNSQLASGTLAFNWFKKPRFLRFLGNTRFSLSTDYSITDKTINDINCNIDQQLFKNGFLQIGYTYNPATRFSILNLGLTYNFIPFRSISTASMSKQDALFTQQVQGSVNFDSNNWKFFFNNTFNKSAVGTGALTLRYFLDENDNGIYDDSEQVIKGANVIIPMGIFDRNYTAGSRNVNNLPPYTRINVSINSESFKNPLWIPKYRDFSFIVDPNSYKQIDIPCMTGGIIEGSLVKASGSKHLPEGFLIHLQSVDSSYTEAIPVFSDGSFYLMAVPPGDYKIWIDKSQLKSMGYETPKPYLEFTIKKSIEGDYIGNLLFKIYNKGTMPATEQPTSDTTLLPVPVPVPSQDTTSTIVQNTQKDSAAIHKADSTVNVKDSILAQLKDTSINDKDSIKNVPADTTGSGGIPQIDLSKDVKPNVMIVFYYNSVKKSALTNEMKRYLDEVAAYMTAHTGARLSIVAHTESFGTLKEHEDVSNKRAQEVVKYLTNKGISASRLFAKGQGALNPVASNLTPEGRNKNRRIELQVIDK